MRFENRGHNDVFRDTAYLDELNAQFAAWLGTLDYDSGASENKERFQADKAEYLRQHLDRDRWSSMLDPDLFDTFADFYDAHMTD